MYTYNCLYICVCIYTYIYIYIYTSPAAPSYGGTAHRDPASQDPSSQNSENIALVS